MQAALGFETLPASLHLHVLSFPTFVENVRCSPVARSWAALLKDPAFWAELRFGGAAEGSVDDETLQQLCRRAGGRLRALDISSPACEAVTAEGLLATLTSDGLGLALESLRTWALADPNSETPPAYRSRRLLFNIDIAAALAGACPVLASAAVDVRGVYADVGPALYILPGPGEKRLAVSGGDGSSRSPERSLPALADWVSAALDGFSVTELELWFRGDEPQVAAEAAAEQAAAARLAAALTSTGRGVRRLRFVGDGTLCETPLLASLCRALTAASLPTELSLAHCEVTDAGAVEIAAALAPGRSRIRSIALSDSHLAGGGAEALMCALWANTTLTELKFCDSELGGREAAAALAASLRSNSTLRSLQLCGCALGSGPDGIASALSALSSTTAAPLRCGLTALDIGYHDLSAAECTALSLALAEPTCRLKTLNLKSCGLGGSGADSGGAVIVRGLEAAGAASRLRSLNLDFNRLGDAAALALGSALAAQGPEGALRELRLGLSRFGPAAAGHLAEGLRYNSSLETLDLGDNPDIGPEGAAAIVLGIAGRSGTASGVKTLSLACCGLGDDGATAMLEAGLGRNATLTDLNLGYNRLGEAGCLALARDWAAARFGVAAGDARPPQGATRDGGAQGGTRAPMPEGAGPQPAPLALYLTVHDKADGRCSLRFRRNELWWVEIERIVERANAAATDAGWRYGRKRSALAIQ